MQSDPLHRRLPLLLLPDFDVPSQLAGQWNCKSSCLLYMNSITRLTSSLSRSTKRLRRMVIWLYVCLDVNDVRRVRCHSRWFEHTVTWMIGSWKNNRMYFWWICFFSAIPVAIDSSIANPRSLNCWRSLCQSSPTCSVVGTKSICIVLCSVELYNTTAVPVLNAPHTHYQATMAIFLHHSKWANTTLGEVNVNACVTMLRCLAIVGRQREHCTNEQ